MTKTYNIRNIRRLLKRGFSDQELLNFCIDEDKFRYGIYDNLPKGPRVRNWRLHPVSRFDEHQQF